MRDILYRWPAATRFGRRVPKEKFYQAGTVLPAVREKFVGEVHSITWTHKLAEATTNLPGNIAVPEVQVLQVESKVEDVSELILIAIDKSIRFPIIFELLRGNGVNQQIRMVAAYKHLDVGAPKLSDYYSTGWQAADKARQPLPTAITLPSLYVALLAPLVPIAMRPGEHLVEVASRLQIARKLEREIATLERKLRAEPQLNRRIELRRTLNSKRAELKQSKE